MNNFQKQNSIGKKGEKYVYDYFAAQGNRKIIDVSNDKEYQKIDVDLIIDGYKFEIKTDNRLINTGNIFIEVGNFRTSGFYPGWYKKCQADILSIYIPQTNQILFYDWPKLKEIISHLETKTYFNKIDCCESVFYLVSLEQAKEALLFEKKGE